MERAASPRFDRPVGRPGKSTDVRHRDGRRANRVAAGLAIVAAAVLCGAQAKPDSADPEQIIFAVRQSGGDGHWYANFGYYAFSEEDKLSKDGGRLCRLNEQIGEVTVLTPKAGPDRQASTSQISKGNNCRDPYPLSEDSFLVAEGPRLLAMNGRGETRELYRLTAMEYVSDGRDRVTTNLPPRSVDTSDRSWPASIAAAEALRRRCTGCHDRSMPMPQYLSDNLGLVLSNPDFKDVRIRFSRHLLFNLSRPEKSLILLAPLAKDAGGYGICGKQDKDGPGNEEAVFIDNRDSDYRKILTLCRVGKEYLQRNRRFDMPGFRPTPTYVREMKKYGILPQELAENAPIDVYATDLVYWRSLWWRPAYDE